MAIITDITKLSQTASLNGPDGSVDPPSSLDDQDRFLGSFIAMLRDGVGFTAGALVTSLGFMPVQQGGNSSGSKTNVVSIGWNTTPQRLVCAVDGNQFSNQWPIDITGQSQSVFDAAHGVTWKFNWNDPGSGGTYVLVSDGNPAGAVYVRQQSQLSVALAANANNAYACSGTSAYASNSAAVNGISGFNYSNRNKNPVYLWASDGSGSDQFLVTPANLTVGTSGYCSGTAVYANSAGSAPANGGTAQNSNQLGGYDQSQFVHNNNNVVWLQSNATIQMQANVGGTVCYWGISASDARLKTAIDDTRADSLADIMRMRFVGFNWRQDLDIELPKEFNPVGVLAQEAELIQPRWIVNSGTWKQPDQYAMLMSAMHSIQQLNAKVAKLSQLITGGS